MAAYRLLTLGPDHEPLWVWLYVHAMGDAWAAMIVEDDVPAPGPGELKGIAFFAQSAVEAEQAAKVYLGCSGPANCLEGEVDLYGSEGSDDADRCRKEGRP